MKPLAQRLRSEVFRVTREGGAIDLVDLVNERITSLDPAEVAALDGHDDVLADRLETAELFEGPAAERQRRSAWAARMVRRPRPIEGLGHPVPGDWELARRLPTMFHPTWREPERWRRLAEEHAGGQRYLALPGLLTDEAARRIKAEVLTLSWTRLATDLVQADRHLLGPDDVPTWLDLLAGEVFRALVGAVLGRPMPAGLVVNAWRLGRGDFMGVHPDGRLYFGTVSLGLCEGWSASQGGAIAFGEPHEAGMIVRQRWYPHLGDVGLFAPDGDTWHVVETVTQGTRHSLTGWWVPPEDGLTRGLRPDDDA